jgi:hypothetical protein
MLKREPLSIRVQIISKKYYWRFCDVQNRFIKISAMNIWNNIYFVFHNIQRKLPPQYYDGSIN